MASNLIPGDLTIRAIKPGDTRKRLSDGAGLYLLLFVKGGSHGWRLNYTINGRRKLLSLGTYPATSLALAREKANKARAMVAAGVDPSEARKGARAAQRAAAEAIGMEAAGVPPAGSFEAVAREWVAQVHQAKVSAGHAERTLIRFEQDVFPWLGRRPVGDVTAAELLVCLRRVLDRGTIETAHRIKDACGQVFRYAMVPGWAARNPAADLRESLPPVPTRHHSAIVEPKRVGELLRAIDAYKGHHVTRCALALAPMLFQRPGELRQAEWAEFDLAAGMWTIPSARMKRTKLGKENGSDHLVPLSRQAVAVLRDLQPVTGAGRYVFPSLRTKARPMSDAAIGASLRRMGFPKDEMSGHGFRAMARTLLAERLGVEVAVIEAQLAHSVPDALGRAYNRAEYLAQRKTMMQAWADYLDRLRKGADVYKLPKRKP